MATLSNPNKSGRLGSRSGDPRGSGLVVAFAFSPIDAGPLRNLARPGPGLVLGGGPTWESDREGHALTLSGAAGQFGTAAIDGRVLAQGTILFRVATLAAPTNHGLFSWAESPYSGGPFLLLRQTGGTSAQWYIDGGYRVVVPLTPSIATTHAVTFARVGTLWSYHVYADGVPLLAYSGAGNSNQANALNLYLGAGYNGLAPGRWTYFAAWDRALSAAEIGDLSARPLDLHRPPRRSTAAASWANPGAGVVPRVGPFPFHLDGIRGGIGDLTGGIQG